MIGKKSVRLKSRIVSDDSDLRKLLFLQKITGFLRVPPYTARSELATIKVVFMFYTRFKDTLRTLLRIRQERVLPPPGEKPAFGSTIILNRLKMQLFVSIDYEQWEWLTLRGWRTLDVRQNRRRYYRVPRNAVIRLMHATPEEREELHQRIITHKYSRKRLQ